MIRNTGTIILSILFSGLAVIGRSQELRIDHVITVVADLDSAVNVFNNLGFSIKRGRLHDNGLLNAHIKFKNNSSFEIMSITLTPTDEVAKNYAALLKNGEGAVFLAITGISTNAMIEKLEALGLGYSRISGKSWDYITFPENSSLAHIFFIDYHIKVDDPNEVLTHRNFTEQLSQVWIEGSDSVRYLFHGLQIQPMEAITDPVLGKGNRYSTKSGDIIIVPVDNPNLRPRIKMVIFGNRDNSIQIPIRF